MKTRTEIRPRLRGDFLLVALFLIAIAVAKPGPAAAGVVIRAGIGPVTVVATSGTRSCAAPVGRVTRHAVMTPGCNDFCCRPPRPGHGRFVWIAGHFEKQLIVEKWTRGHKAANRPVKVVFKSAGHGKKKMVKMSGNHGRRAPVKRYRTVWVPGHWERI